MQVKCVVFLKGGTKHGNRNGYWSFINVRLLIIFMLHELIQFLFTKKVRELADFSTLIANFSAHSPRKLGKGQPRLCEATPLVFNRQHFS